MSLKNLRLLIFISSIHLLFIIDVKGQAGFTKILNLPNSGNVDIDGINFHNNYLYISGNSYDPTDELWGTFIAKLDTTGEIIWHKEFFDSLKNDLIVNLPCRFSFGVNNTILSLAFSSSHAMELMVNDSTGNPIFQKQFETNDKFIFPMDVREIENHYYLFGFVQRFNYNIDGMVIKADTSGKLNWIKYYTAGNLDVVFGGVFINSNNTITITASASKEGWYNQSEITGSNQPWVFTIDTSGTILDQWFGNDNDTRTNGRGPLYRATNGDYIISSYDIKYNPTYGEVDASPTITRLDSNFNLVWKRNFTNFTYPYDKIQDMSYDSIRDEFIVVGDQLIFYTPDSVGADIWFAKISGTGEIVWNKSETALYLDNQIHYTSGIAIAPSGSMYVAGWVYSQANKKQGWIMKVTPDGCTDTLCTITSIEDKLIKNRKQIGIRPNPVYDELHISIPIECSGAIVEIMNLQGQHVFQAPLNTTDNVIEADFPSGFYFYSIRNQNQIIGSGKFIRM